MRHLYAPLTCLLLLVATALPATAKTGELVMYSGRSKSLVQPLIDQFTRDTGIPVVVNYGGTTELALQVATEGKQSPCDVFWAQDAGALGLLSKDGLLSPLKSTLLDKVPPKYRSAKGEWVATSGRVRVLAYAPGRIAASALPSSVFDLTQPVYKGKVGWAPTNGSFQVFVTAMRAEFGDTRTLNWLKGMRANGAKAYSNNTGIVEAIAAGEVDLGLPNHYYLLRYKKSNANYPVENGRFAAEDIGNLLNVAGVGVLKSSDMPTQAAQLVEYLLSGKAQQYFASDVLEYPVTGEVIPNSALWPLTEMLDHAPGVDLDALDDLEGTLELLQAAELL